VVWKTVAAPPVNSCPAADAGIIDVFREQVRTG
jgi:hypothetical protein